MGTQREHSQLLSNAQILVLGGTGETGLGQKLVRVAPSGISARMCSLSDAPLHPTATRCYFLLEPELLPLWGQPAQPWQLSLDSTAFAPELTGLKKGGWTLLKAISPPPLWSPLLFTQARQPAALGRS